MPGCTIGVGEGGGGDGRVRCCGCLAVRRRRRLGGLSRVWGKDAGRVWRKGRSRFGRLGWLERLLLEILIYRMKYYGFQLSVLPWQ